MVTREQVLHVARLAKLELAPGEIETFAGQLGRILDYVETLRELDGVEIEEHTHVAVVDVALREGRTRAPVFRARKCSRSRPNPMARPCWCPR